MTMPGGLPEKLLLPPKRWRWSDQTNHDVICNLFLPEPPETRQKHLGLMMTLDMCNLFSQKSLRTTTQSPTVVMTLDVCCQPDNHHKPQEKLRAQNFLDYVKVTSINFVDGSRFIHVLAARMLKTPASHPSEHDHLGGSSIIIFPRVRVRVSLQIVSRDPNSIG